MLRVVSLFCRWWAINIGGGDQGEEEEVEGEEKGSGSYSLGSHLGRLDWLVKRKALSFRRISNLIERGCVWSGTYRVFIDGVR